MTKYQGPYGVSDPNASYINGDPSIGRQGSIPPGAAFENPQREIVNLISDSQQTPSDADLHQMTRAVRDGRLNFCVDSGPLNQLQVVAAGPDFQAYNAGLTLRVLVAHTNTGPVRIVLNTLNPTSVKRRDGSELQANDLLAGMVATLVCDGSSFQLQNQPAAAAGGGTTNIYQIDIPYVRDTSVNANRLIGAYSPPLADIREGRTVEIKVANNVTGPTTFIPNNFPEHAVTHPDGSPIKAGDLVINQIALLAFDGVNWQLLGVYFSSVPATPIGAGSKKSLKFHRATGAGYSVHTCSKLQRFPALNTNRQIFSVSLFAKRPDSGLIQDQTTAWADGIGEYSVFSAGEAAGGAYAGYYYTGTANGNQFNLFWNDSHQLVSGSGFYNNGGGLWGYQTIGMMMDTRWHHLLFTADGAHLSLTIDGTMTHQAPVSGNSPVNSTAMHVIGTDATPAGMDWPGIDWYIAEFVLIDGLCLTADKFANNIGGNIVPIDVTQLNFGTNGCYLNWSDSSAVTSTTLGKDWSGNNNNWQPMNFDTTMISTDYPGK